MTINAPAAIVLLMYQIVGEEQGADREKLGGTIQNDPLKEYQARGTYIYPPRPSMRLVTDTFAYCAKHLPQWNPISISGYHMREAGCSAAQEIAFTLANAIAYVEAGLAAGLTVDAFAPRLSFFFGAHNDLFEEVAKFRAARRLWATMMQERFGAQDKRSLLLRFHTQTCGCTLTAQQPYNNVVRVALQGLAAVLGGTQSLHTNSFDEALGLPTEHAATLALRTQQIIAEESGVTATADPLGGSYYVEALTDGVEHEARRWMERVAERGGAVAATETRLHRGRDLPSTPTGRRWGRSAASGSSSVSIAIRSRRRSRCRSSGPIRTRRRTRPPPEGASRGAQRHRLRFGARRRPHRRAGRRAKCSARCAPPCSRARRSAKSAPRCAMSGAPIARRGRC